MHPTIATIRQASRLVDTHRKLWIPFLVAASVELLCITLLWLAAHPPYSKLLAPPIRYAFGERVLHYPTHLWFLYYAMKHVHVFASIVVGAFCTGLACVMVKHLHEGAPASLRHALVSRQVRYGAVTLLWILTWVLGKTTMELLARVAPTTMWSFWGGILLSVGLQMLVIYAIPIAVLQRISVWRSLGRSVRETFRHPVVTAVLVIGLSLPLLAFSVWAPPVVVARLMQRTAPEIVLVFMAARILIWTTVDAVMSTAVTHVWCTHQRASQPLAKSREEVRAPSVVLASLEEGHAVA